MKNVILFIAAVVLGGTLSFANNTSEPKKSTITVEVEQLLASPTLAFKSQETKAMVMLTVNNCNQLVVVDVNCNDKEVVEFVKSRLNYKELKKNTLVKGQIYKMPLTIVSNS